MRKTFPSVRRRAEGTALLAAALAACGGERPPSTPTGPNSTGLNDTVRFASPLQGAPFSPQFYGAYFDHGVGDYNCGGKTYDGHRGVDILLRNFQVQDSGVAVVAAAAGMVQAILDGLFDRSTVTGRGGSGNFVRLDHGNVASLYAHLRQGSISVVVGQRVDAGTVLGLVGSSGNSNWPHLHFEVQDFSAVDPFSGPCNLRTSRWSSQLAYQDSFMVTDAGVVRNSATFWQLLERPPQDTITTADSALTYWLQLFNVQFAQPVRFDVYQPDSALYQSFESFVGRTYSMSYLTFRLDVAGALTVPGLWRIEYVQSGIPVHVQPFVLEPAPVVVQAPGRRPPAAEIVMLGQGGEGPPP